MKTMKKIGLMGLMGLMAGGALAADNVITNYLPAYREVLSTCTNTGNSGLSTGVTYFCFAATDVAQLTEAQGGTGTNGSMAQLMYAINEAFYTGWAAHATTNRPTRVTIGRSTGLAAEADYAVIHQVTAQMTMTGAATVAAE